MGGKSATITGLIFFLILAYLLLDHFLGATSILDTSTKGSVSVIKALQGR